MVQRLRTILVWFCAGAEVACFAAHVVLKAGQEPGQPGLWTLLRKYGDWIVAVFVVLALALVFARQLVPPPGEVGPPSGADDPAYDRYRLKGGLALIAGWIFVLLGGVNQLARLGDETPAPNSWVGFVGLVLLAVGAIYRYDLPNMYRRVSDLEERLQRRIDALANGHAGNGEESPGNGTDPPSGGGPDLHDRLRS